MRVCRSAVALGCAAAICLACAAAPPDDLPADTAVVVSDGLWLRTPWEPASPVSETSQSGPFAVMSLLDIPELRITIAVLVESSRRPAEPNAPGWQPFGQFLRRCRPSAAGPSCTEPATGMVYVGPGGLLMHLADRALLDTFRIRRPAYFLRRAADSPDGQFVDSIPIVYRP